MNTHDTDHLDDLLRQWHDTNRADAESSRDAILAAIAKRTEEAHEPVARIGDGEAPAAQRAIETKPGVIARIMRSPALPLAASVALIATVAALMLPGAPEQDDRLALAPQAEMRSAPTEESSPDPARRRAADKQLARAPAGGNVESLSQSLAPTEPAANTRAARFLNAGYHPPEGGSLEARDDRGEAIGPCPLTHTDVSVVITGRFARVNLTQHFYNPFPDKIEALYTFPMSQDAAVDAMTMTIGDRVIVGEVKERTRARQIYEAARAAGNVASLLEQERPNIFTQSVANIEPATEVRIDISYVELIDESEGEYAFDFPMTVGPRYIPGNPAESHPGANATPEDNFAADTDEVPDASRITPRPTPPDTRAGHDISINVTLDTGGPELLSCESPSHPITSTILAADEGRVTSRSFTLADRDTIPNKDFVLRWRQDASDIQQSVFTYSSDGEHFVTLIIDPPARIEDARALPKELIFVLDTSGSMSGFPMDKSKQVMREALNRVRPQDRINIITFAGSTQTLWPEPVPATAENISRARTFIDSLRGAGGTEMMTAINAALTQQPADKPTALSLDELANLPADGRTVTVAIPWNALTRRDANAEPWIFHTTTGIPIRTTPFQTERENTRPFCRVGETTHLTGRWSTIDGRRILRVDRATAGEAPIPLRIVTFLTDGYVGNDMAILGAIKDNAHTTRVFSFGIGNSVNRYLLDSMARAGRGEAEYLLLDEGAEQKVAKFARRISTPLLRDPVVEFDESLAISNVVSPDSMDEPAPIDNTNRRFRLPDLFDARPIVIHARRSGTEAGTVTLRGMTAAGPYEKTLTIPAARDTPNTHLPTLWARAKVEHLMNEDLRAAQSGNFPADLREQIVRLGETYSIVTQFTSFVAVDKARVTIGGEPRLVHVPVELPEGVAWEGIFGELNKQTIDWCGTPVMRQALREQHDKPGLASEATKENQTSRSQLRRFAGTNERHRSSITLRQAQMSTLGIQAQQAPDSEVEHVGAGALTRTDAANRESAEPSRDTAIARMALEMGIVDEEPEADAPELNPTEQRKLTLLRILAPSLLDKLAAYETITDEEAKQQRGTEKLRITILLTDLSDATLAALRERGANVISTNNDASIAIADITLAKLADIALLDAVRRIEPLDD